MATKMLQVPQLVENTCKICGKTGIYKTYIAREMMFGTKDEFTYFVCEYCQCMQIDKIPDNLDKYYGEDYYSFKVSTKDIDLEEKIEKGPNILDVGCGSGEYLLALAQERGYRNLFGCDPYISHDIYYGDAIYIKKGTIHEIEGKFEYIVLRDSFEHMDNPNETIKQIKSLLGKNGECHISIPIFPNSAFDTFGVDWFQLDAPRHLFLHSLKSMKYMCNMNNLKVKSIVYNSSDAQFISSYLYTLDIPWVVHSKVIEDYFTLNDREYFKENAKIVNEKGYGDHALLIIVHDVVE